MILEKSDSPLIIEKGNIVILEKAEDSYGMDNNTFIT